MRGPIPLSDAFFTSGLTGDRGVALGPLNGVAGAVRSVSGAISLRYSGFFCWRIRRA